jgi:hypothetical protein
MWLAPEVVQKMGKRPFIDLLSILNNDAEMQHGEPAATTLRQLQTTKLETVEIQF